jgi:hypothetical protein
VLIRDKRLDSAIVTLRAWASDLRDAGDIHGAFLFGSTVNSGGFQYEADRSDLDIIVLVDWEGLSPEKRVAALNRLAEHKHQLELKLLPVVGWDDASKPITSLVPLTPFEVAHAVHKDGAGAIVRSSALLDLLTGEMRPSLNPDAPSDGLSETHRSAAQFVQKKRAGHLSRSSNNKGGLGQVHVDLADAAPKDLMRQFAVASSEPGESSESLTDINRGLSLFESYLTNFAPDATDAILMRDWLRARRGGRGAADAMSTDAYLFGVEAVFDKLQDWYPATASVSLTPEAREWPARPQQKPLPASFSFTARNTLGGGTKAVERAVENARVNLGHLHQPGFQLTFEEAVDVDALLERDSAKLSARDHKRQKDAFARRSMIAHRTVDIERGVGRILYYGGLMLPQPSQPLASLLRRSIEAFIRHVLEYGSANLGGGTDAWHIDLYPNTPQAQFTFSMGEIPGEVAQVSAIDSEILAEKFVPELVVAAWRREAGLDRPMTPDELETFFTTYQWECGPH